MNEFIKVVNLEECDEIDKEETGKDFYITIPQRNEEKGEEGIIYTNDPIHEILGKLKPDEIYWYPYNIKGEIVSLYVNCFLIDGYYIDCERARDFDYDEIDKQNTAMISPSLYFKKRK